MALQLMACHTFGQGQEAAAREPLGLRISPEFGAAGPRVGKGAAPARSREALRLRPAQELPGAPPAATVEAPVTPQAAEQMVLGSVRLNGIKIAESAVLIRDPEGSFLVRADDLVAWGLQPPEISLDRNGDRFYALADVPAIESQFDDSSQELVIRAGAAAFPTTRWGSKGSEMIVAGSVSPGAFLNYDFQSYHQPGFDTQLDGLAELGVFNEWGLGVTNFLLRNLGGQASPIRLETTLSRDFPETMASLRIGDAISNPGSLGSAVRFGGVQWATNFATRPGFVTFPQPSLQGEATLPSVVDVFVNDSLRMSQDIPPGPFEIANVPVVTGDGNIRLVQRDLLGRQQVIVVPYYATSDLLHKGLHAYSYEAGTIRENYGLESHDYGRPFGAATHRYGMTDRITGEVHAEGTGDQQTVGLTGSALFSSLITATLGAAGSHSPEGEGGKAIAGVERQASIFTFGGRIERATGDFVSLGTTSVRTRSLSAIFLGFGLGRGSVSLNYTDQERTDGRTKLTSVSYGIPLTRQASLNLFALHSEDATVSNYVSATLTYAFDARTTAALGATHQTGSSDQTVLVQQALPTQGGVALRALGGTGTTDRVEGGASVLTDFGLYTADASRVESRELYRLGMSGGIALIDRSAYLTRRIDESFAVVKVPGYPNLGLYRNNLLIGHTDDDGDALIPNLLPYDANYISLEVTDLPIDASPESLKIDVVPRLRSGTLVRFNVASASGAVITMVQENGDPVPLGAIVTRDGSDEEFPVGQRGEVYVTGIAEQVKLHARWRNLSCRIETTLPRDGQPLPKIGPVTCRK